MTTPLPPGPKVGPLLFLAFRGQMLGLFQHLVQRYGPVSTMKTGRFRFFLFNEPELVKDVLMTQEGAFRKGAGLQFAKQLLGEGLLTSEGAFHKRQRRLVMPAFHRERIAQYAQVMVEEAAKRRDNWQDGSVLDVDAEMMSLTLVVVGKTLFGTNVEGSVREVGDAITTSLSLFRRFYNPFSALLAKLPLPSNRRFEAAKATLDRIVYGMIEERRRAPADRGDLLSMLLLAQDEEGDGTGMSDQQVRDEALTLFLAGHETTANALTWTCYLLSQHPEVEARLLAEIDQVLQGRPATFEDVPRLSYVRMVLSESMRLYPPAWMVGRQALRDVTIGEWTVPEGAMALASPFLMHRDSRFYPDPLRFDPERWQPEEKAGRPRFSYFPFGAGTRVCIGEQFAWTEAILILATLYQKWRLRLVEGHPVEVQPLFTLRPRYGMRMRLEERAPSPAALQPASQAP